MNSVQKAELDELLQSGREHGIGVPRPRSAIGARHGQNSVSGTTGTSNTNRPKLTRDKSLDDEGSLDIVEHLIAIILQENSSYLEKLLQNEEVLEILDYQDNKGFTPLCIACDKYDVECCRLLLHAGANPNIVDNFGRSPLHWVVSGGCHCESCNVKRANCVKLLVQARTNIETEDQNGETALFYAANNMLTNSAIVLLENGAEISKTNLKGINLGQLLVQKIPFVMVQLLDSCIGFDEEDNSDLKIDFSVLLDSAVRKPSSPSQDDLEGGFDVSKTRTTATMTRTKPAAKKPKKEMELLNCMLKAYPIGRELLLTHPATETFVYLKWKYIYKWFWFIRVFYCLLTILYTYFIFNFYLYQCPYHGNNDEFLRSTTDLIARPLYPCQQKPLELPMNSYIIIGCICLYFLFMLLNQLNLFCFSFKYYCRNGGVNLGWWILIVSGILCLLPPIGIIPLNYWVYPLAAFSLFWAWTMNLVHLSRIPCLGTFVEMFAKALQELLIIGSIFSSFFMAFVLGFCVLFPQNSMFQEIPAAAVKVFLMMVGDREYDKMFTSSSTAGQNQEEEEGLNSSSSSGSATLEDRLLHLDYNIPAHLFYLAFIIIFGILMINLLVGLAVSDIQELRKDAELIQICRQISELGRFEEFLTRSWLSSCCRKCFQSIVSVEARNGRYFNFCPTDPTDTSLPTFLKKKFVPYLSTRPCLKYKRHISSKSRVLQRQESTITSTNDNRPFYYVNDNLETILSDLKIRLEGLSRRSAAATPMHSAGHGHVSGSTTPVNNNYYTPNSVYSAGSFFSRA